MSCGIMVSFLMPSNAKPVPRSSTSVRGMHLSSERMPKNANQEIRNRGAVLPESRESNISPLFLASLSDSSHFDPNACNCPCYDTPNEIHPVIHNQAAGSVVHRVVSRYSNSYFSEFVQQMPSISPINYSKNFHGKANTCDVNSHHALNNTNPHQCSFINHLEPACGSSIITSTIHHPPFQCDHSDLRSEIQQDLQIDVLSFNRHIHSDSRTSKEVLFEPLVKNSVPKNNKGFDNADNDYICRRGEIFYRSEIDRRYIAEEFIGKGAFGQVIRCEEQTMSGKRLRLVAVKIIKNQPAFLTQAVMEIRSLLRLSSNFPSSEFLHVARLYDYFVYRNHLFVVLHLLEDNLYEVMRQRNFCSMPLQAIQHFSAQLFETLVLLGASNIIHCDIKPENIMIECNSAAKRFCWPPPNDEAAYLSTRQLPQKLQQESLKVVLPAMTDGRKVKKVSFEAPCESLWQRQRRRSSNRADKNKKTKHVEVFQSHCPPYLTDAFTKSVTPTKPSLPRAPSGDRISNIASLLDSFIPITLIDFGSSCFESESYSGYIQSRYYRAPEIILGGLHWHAIDIWSAGCICAELFLGVPLFGGVDEFDQVQRITRLVGAPPDWILNRATKTSCFFKRKVGDLGESDSEWELKTPPVSHPRYYREMEFNSLEEVMNMLPFPAKMATEEREAEQNLRLLFLDFLKKCLDPNPFTRITALEALSHPFVYQGLRVELVGKTIRQFGKMFPAVYGGAEAAPGLSVQQLNSTLAERDITAAGWLNYVVKALNIGGLRLLERITESTISKGIDSKICRLQDLLVKAKRDRHSVNEMQYKRLIAKTMLHRRSTSPEA